MSKLTVVIKELKCIKTEDPVNDELYFFVSAGTSKTKNSKTKRRIHKGDTKRNIRIEPLDVDRKKTNVLVLTGVEQRAIRDDREKIIEQIEKFAEKASEYVAKAITDFLSKNGPDNEAMRIIVEKTLKKALNGAPNFFKKIFKDTPLFAIPIYVLKGESSIIKTFKVDNNSQESLTANRYSYELTVSVKVE